MHGGLPSGAGEGESGQGLRAGAAPQGLDQGLGVGPTRLCAGSIERLHVAGFLTRGRPAGAQRRHQRVGGEQGEKGFLEPDDPMVVPLQVDQFMGDHGPRDRPVARRRQSGGQDEARRRESGEEGLGRARADADARGPKRQAAGDFVDHRDRPDVGLSEPAQQAAQPPGAEPEPPQPPDRRDRRRGQYHGRDQIRIERRGHRRRGGQGGGLQQRRGGGERRRDGYLAHRRGRQQQQADRQRRQGGQGQGGGPYPVAQPRVRAPHLDQTPPYPRHARRGHRKPERQRQKVGSVHQPSSVPEGSAASASSSAAMSASLSNWLPEKAAAGSGPSTSSRAPSRRISPPITATFGWPGS